MHPGNTGRLALLVDEVTGMQFLVDTGAVFSVLPYTSSKLPTGPRITTADKSPIPCWGWVQQRILAGGTYFDWKFLRASVAFPILGADFLENFDLWVDLRRARLLRRRGAPIRLRCPAVGGSYSKCGILPAAVLVEQPLSGEAVDSSRAAVDSSRAAVEFLGRLWTLLHLQGTPAGHLRQRWRRTPASLMQYWRESSQLFSMPPRICRR